MWKVGLTLPFLFCVAIADVTAAQGTSQIEVMAEDKAGGPVSGLRADDFEIRSGKDVCSAVSVRQNDEPMTIGILVDTSSSMKDKIGDGRVLRDAVKTFLDQSHPGNYYFVVQFAGDVNLLLDYSQDHGEVLDALPTRCRGGSLLFQALEACQNKLGQRQGRKALLVVSDGSDITGRSAERTIEAMEMPVFGLGPMAPGDYFEPRESALPQVCEATGGKFREETELTREAGKFALLLRSAYLLNVDCVTTSRHRPTLSIKLSKQRRDVRVLYSRHALR